MSDSIEYMRLRFTQGERWVASGHYISPELVAKARADFDRRLAEHDHEVRAEAWAEGFEAGQDEADGHQASRQWGGPHTCITNPYRKEKE